MYFACLDFDVYGGENESKTIRYLIKRFQHKQDCVFNFKEKSFLEQNNFLFHNHSYINLGVHRVRLV